MFIQKEEWLQALREIFSLIDFAARSILNKIEIIKLNHQLEQLSITDTLTGAFNRRQLMVMLAHEIELFQRYGHPFSLILLDIDHFKNVNDTFCHQYGDEVLVKISKLVKKELRSSDSFFQYGGKNLSFSFQI